MKIALVVAGLGSYALLLTGWVSYSIGHTNGKSDEWQRNFKREQIQRLETKDTLNDAEKIRYKELRKEVNE